MKLLSCVSFIYCLHYIYCVQDYFDSSYSLSRVKYEAIPQTLCNCESESTFLLSKNKKQIIVNNYES